MNRNRFFVIELLTVVALVVLDLLTKQLAVKYLSDGKLTVINGVFSFTLLEGGNSGAAFGLFQYFPMHFALVLLLAGALGNFADRVLTMIKYGHSYVIDFLYFELINFPIFNVADCYVTIAAFTMLIFGIFYYKDEDFDKMLGRVKNEVK